MIVPPFKDIREVRQRIVHLYLQTGMEAPLDDYFTVQTVRQWVRNARKSQWPRLRGEVYQRDKGICDVCALRVEDAHYNCGHIVDRCVGGEDALENLVVMHEICNQLKPVHRSAEEYREWKAGVGL